MIVLRNALNDQLTIHHGTQAGHRYDDPNSVFSGFAHQDIATARRRVHKPQRPEAPGKVITELNFGFWKFLLAKRYEATLWTGHLRHAFPNLRPQSCMAVYQTLDVLHTVRSSAHHEPTYRCDLAADALASEHTLSRMDADVDAWALRLSRLRLLSDPRSVSVQ